MLTYVNIGFLTPHGEGVKYFDKLKKIYKIRFINSKNIGIILQSDMVSLICHKHMYGIEKKKTDYYEFDLKDSSL